MRVDGASLIVSPPVADAQQKPALTASSSGPIPSHGQPAHGEDPGGGTGPGYGDWVSPGLAGAPARDGSAAVPFRAARSVSSDC